MVNGKIDEDVEDDISVTSTIEESPDSDHEWPVNRVLAEGEIDGEVEYLIEWQGFSLAEATWEPRSNLKNALLADWEKTKQEQKNGLVPKFKISEWREASIQAFQAKVARHERRNRKRARLGLKESVWQSSFKDLIQDLDNHPQEREEQDENTVKTKKRQDLMKDGEATSNTAGGSPRKTNIRDTVPASPPKSPTIQKKRKPESDKHPLPGVPLRSASYSGSAGSQKDGGNVLRRRSIDQVVQSKSAFESTEGARRESTSNASSSNHPERDAQEQSEQPRPDLSKHSISEKNSTMGLTNVFAAGRVRKGKPTLREAALDPNKQPKLLNSHLQRLLELRRRDREGAVAPAQRPTALFSLDQSNPKIVRRDEPVSPGEPTSLGDTALLDESVAVDKPVSLDEPGGNGAETEQPKPKNKRRAVHWDDDPMELDPEESLFVSEKLPFPTKDLSNVGHSQTDALEVSKPSEPEKPPEPAKPSSILKRISLIEYKAQSTRHTLKKECQFGHNTQTITLSFSGMPLDQDSWLSTFMLHNCLVFSHTCIAQDFVSQAQHGGPLVVRSLSEGRISSATDTAILRTLADRLGLGSLGLLCHTEDYCVLLFPSDCKDWGPEKLCSDANSTQYPLRYSIFKPNPSFETSRLAAIPNSIMPNRQGGDVGLHSRPFERIFGPKYEALIPPGITDKAAKHHFFLAFPLLAIHEAAVLSRWLRCSHPDCDIRTSHSEGHWSSFMKGSHGVVIIHEDAIWAIRMFPNLGSLLHGSSSNFKFWVFTRSHRPVSLFDSIDAPIPGVGDIHLHRVFNRRPAILLTPSFLVSQPEQAYNMMKYVFQNYSKHAEINRRGKLVVCSRFGEWLFDLAMEQIKLRENRSITVTSSELKQMGLSGKALEARLKTWNLFRQLAAESIDEESTCLVFAPESLDGNDEQSLVNWFGYWSIMNMDEFRKFTVLGSSNSGVRRLSRVLQPPNYKRPMISDPNELYPAPDPSNQPDLGTATLPVGPRPIRDDDASEIINRLRMVSDKSQALKWCPVSLYWFPMAYWHCDMPYRLGDITSKYTSYPQWLKFFRNDFANSATRNKSPYNTFAAFFYTVEAKWDPSITLTNPRRHPWVAFYRAVNPHIRPWKCIELFIWDLGHLEKINKGKKLCYDDLPQAQQELIRHFQDPSKSPLPLEKVWVGAFSAPQTNEVSPLEITLRWLDDAMGNVRNWIPAPAKQLAARGWSLVASEKMMEEHDVDDVNDAALTADAMDIDTPVKVNDPTALKMIFHPPRGNIQKGYTKCRNLLHQRAMEAEAKREKTFDYTYRPTLEWYREQIDEGRGFGHIKVASWEEIFALYKIEDPEKI